MRLKEKRNFYAEVDGGVGTITYQWYRRNVGGTWYAQGTGSSQQISMVTTNLEVKVVVTRGSETANDVKTVYYTNAPPPPPDDDDPRRPRKASGK